MALLIEAINGTFTLGDETFRGPWPAYSVFYVPQAKIVEMQSMRPDESVGRQEERYCWLLCPYCCERPVQGHHIHDRPQLHRQQCVGTCQKLLQTATGASGALCHDVPHLIRDTDRLRIPCLTAEASILDNEG